MPIGLSRGGSGHFEIVPPAGRYNSCPAGGTRLVGRRRCGFWIGSPIVLPDPQEQTEATVDDLEPLLGVAGERNVVTGAEMNNGRRQHFLARVKGGARPVTHDLAFEEVPIVAHADVGVCDLSCKEIPAVLLKVEKPEGCDDLRLGTARSTVPRQA